MREIGTEITITPKLDYMYNNHRGELDILSEMIYYQGKKAKITSCIPQFKAYTLDIDDGRFFWYEELFIEPETLEETTDNKVKF